MRLSHLRRPLFLALLAYAAALCVLRSSGALAKAGAEDASRLAPLASATVSGRAASIAVEKRGRQEFLIETLSIDGRPVRGRLLVRLASSEPVDWGDELTLRGKLSRPPAPAVPGTLGWRGHLALRRVHAIVWADGIEARRPSRNVLLRSVSGARHQMIEVFKNRLGLERGAILSGIVLGEKSDLPRETLEVFRDAGAIHLLVASGSNVTFVLLIVAGLLSRAGLGRGACVGAGLAASGLYTLAAGADAPLVRAYVMTSAGALGFALDRDSGAFQGLVVAAWLLLLAEPLALFQPGFQLSFAATLGIVAAVSHWKVPRRWPKAVRFAAQILIVSLAAQLAVSPILAAYFHRLSLAAVFSNLVLVPLAGALMAAGFALHAASLLPWSWPAACVAAVASAGLAVFERTVAFFGGLPWSSVVAASPSLGFLLAYALVALAVLCAPDVRRARAFALAGLAAAVLAGLSALRPGPVEAMVLTRSASVLRSPDGRLIVVGAGARGEDLAEAVLGSGRRTIDELRLTSLKRQEWRGLEALASRIAVRSVVAPPGPLEPELAGMRAALEAAGTRWEEAWPGARRLGEVEVRESWRGYSGRSDATEVELAWKGLSARFEPGGPAIQGPFDIIRARPPYGFSFDGRTLRADPS